MARIRTVKPEFFTSEDIVGLSPFARLLFIATWCEADREGRLPWKTRTLKLRYFPGDSFDIDACARELVASGLVVLYGDGLAFIPTFAKHQHLNPRESASILPDPDASARVNDAYLRVTDAQGGREGKGREGKEEQLCASADADAPPTKSDPIPYQAIVDTYNRTMTGLAKVRVITAKRRTAIRSVWHASDKFRSERFFESFFAECQESNFLNGTGPYTNGHANWLPDFDYLMQPKVATKVYERAMQEMEAEDAH